jgi:DNA repair ATPase RecN
VNDTAQLHDAFNKDGQQLIGAGLGSDPALMKEISTVNKEYHDVTGSVDTLQAQLDDVVAEVAKFEAEHDVIDKDLKSLEEKAEGINAKAVGGEPDEINKQLEEVKVRCNTIYLQTTFDIQYEPYSGLCLNKSKKLNLLRRYERRLFFKRLSVAQDINVVFLRGS